MKIKSYFSVLLVTLLAFAIPAQAWNLNAYIPTLSEKTKKISAIAAGVLFGGLALWKVIKHYVAKREAQLQKDILVVNAAVEKTRADWDEVQKKQKEQAAKEAYDQVYKTWYNKIVCLDESAINQLSFDVTYHRNIGTLDRVMASPVTAPLQKVRLFRYHKPNASEKQLYSFDADKQDLEIIQKVCNEILKEREHEQVRIAQECHEIAHAFDGL